MLLKLFGVRAKSSFINISEALKLAKASPKVITLFKDFALEKQRVAENYQQELIKAKDEVVKAKDEVVKAKDELSDLRSELVQLKSDGISFQEVFHLAYFRSFQEHWETEVKDILWPGINVKNVSRSTLYDAIKKGNTFTWRKGFVPTHDDPAMALKNARKTAQEIKDLFEDCNVPDFDQVASKSYSQASRLIHLVYTDYFRRNGLNVKMPKLISAEIGEKLECFHSKAREFAKANCLKCHAEPYEIKMGALQAIHDAIFEAEEERRNDTRIWGEEYECAADNFSPELDECEQSESADFKIDQVEA